MATCRVCGKEVGLSSPLIDGVCEDCIREGKMPELPPLSQTASKGDALVRRVRLLEVKVNALVVLVLLGFFFFFLMVFGRDLMNW